MDEKQAPALSPQDRPIVLKDASGQLAAAFKVDSARVKAKTMILDGWSTNECKLELWHNGSQLVHSLERYKRPDVANKLQLTEALQSLGYTLSARQVAPDVRTIELRVTPMIGRKPQTFSYPIELLPDEEHHAKHHSMDSDAVGYIESAVLSPITGDAVVVGWLVAGQGARVWLENDAGLELPLDGAYRFFRQDVADAHGGQYGLAVREAGLMVHWAGAAPSQTIKLMTSDGDKMRVLSEVTVGRIGVDPVAAAQRLFGMPSPMRDMAKRCTKVDMPMLGALIEKSCQGWVNLPNEHRLLGTQVAHPSVSIIIPLFGRADFVEHQLIEFSRDAWLQAHSQIIYVVDDARLLDTVTHLAEQWARLYRVPFEWVWGGVNRGFSGANNLGASLARAPNLLFMNSDVIPRQPGWLEALNDALASHPDVGAICPRLLFPDGTLQHAGMQFMRREELGIWTNHHPLMGCPPELDPHTELTPMPAVTGACLLMRQADYQRIGGWDTGYLIGDFEDSDLCFKLRTAGMQVAYLPTVALTHLERQSFKTLGQGEFRQRVVIYNAVRHQNRWSKHLEAPVEQAPAATVKKAKKRV
jgi:GT2 family glycosyltransferase